MKDKLDSTNEKSEQEERNTINKNEDIDFDDGYEYTDRDKRKIAELVENRKVKAIKNECNEMSREYLSSLSEEKRNNFLESKIKTGHDISDHRNSMRRLNNIPEEFLTEKLVSLAIEICGEYFHAISLIPEKFRGSGTVSSAIKSAIKGQRLSVCFFYTNKDVHDFLKQYEWFFFSEIKEFIHLKADSNMYRELSDETIQKAAMNLFLIPNDARKRLERYLKSNLDRPKLVHVNGRMTNYDPEKLYNRIKKLVLKMVREERVKNGMPSWKANFLHLLGL